MAEVLGEGTIVLPVCEAYRAVTEKYPTLVDPYLEPGVECGDNGQQKNFFSRKMDKSEVYECQLRKHHSSSRQIEK